MTPADLGLALSIIGAAGLACMFLVLIGLSIEEMLRKEQLPYHEVYGDATAPTQVLGVLQRLQAHRLL